MFAQHLINKNNYSLKKNYSEKNRRMKTLIWIETSDMDIFRYQEVLHHIGGKKYIMGYVEKMCSNVN